MYNNYKVDKFLTSGGSRIFFVGGARGGGGGLNSSEGVLKN